MDAFREKEYLIKKLPDNALKNKNSGHELINNGIPIIKDTLNQIANTENLAFTITDEEGCILVLAGDQQSISNLERAGLVPGYLQASDNPAIQTFAQVIKHKTAIISRSGEQGRPAWKNMDIAAVPVMNYNNRLIGVIGLFISSGPINSYVLSILRLAATIISDRLWNTLIQNQLNNERLYAFNIMNNLSYGLFAITVEEKIHWINDTACRTLNIRRTRLINQHIATIIHKWDEIRKQLIRGNIISDEEYVIQVGQITEKYIINAYSITNLTKQTLGYVVSIRPLSRMLKIIGRYSMNNAYFGMKDILGASEAMKHAIEVAKTASKSPSTILITGESGTGKEVFAQAIHNFSNRKNNNFIAINCGAISSSLIESELFGYEEGAFTGAQKKGRPGKFEIANNGTLFLDEIGEMPFEMQVKLLRAIQEKMITRLGGTSEIPIDVRIIAATNKDLAEEMKKGTFRSDLYYRLSVIPIHLPSLRQRPEDIPEMIQFFLKQKGQLLSKPIPAISPETMEQLVSYSWPGNVRELENTIEKLVLFDQQKDILPSLPTKPETNREKPYIPSGGPFLSRLDDIEKDAIAHTLVQCEWNISKTADILGVARNTLYAKMKKYKIMPHPDVQYPNSVQ